MVARGWFAPPLADERRPILAKDLNAVTPSMGEGSTVYVAVEISDKSWVGGIGLPVDPGKVGMHMLTPADTDGLVAKIDQACARAGGSQSDRSLDAYGAGGGSAGKSKKQRYNGKLRSY